MEIVSLLDKLEEIKKDLKENLSAKRFAHVESVVKTSLLYADQLGLVGKDKERLELAAWLHDVCKELKGDELLGLAKHYAIKIYDEDRASPNVLHARVGASFVEDKYEIFDPEVLAAIREHTLGTEKMSIISKILYLADFSEPNRDIKDKEKDPNAKTFCDPARKAIAAGELDTALLSAMDSKLEFVIKKKAAIHPLAIDARNALL